MTPASDSHPRPAHSQLALAVLALFAFAAPLVLLAARGSVAGNKNKVEDWLPDRYQETQELRWFREHFGGNGFVVISWEGCRLGGDPSDPNADPDDPRIEQLARLLTENPSKEPDLQWKGGAHRPAFHRYFQAATTGRRLLDQLTASPVELPYAIAVDRLKGALIGPDGHQTCVLVTLSDEAIRDFRAVLGRRWEGVARRRQGVLFDALWACNIPADQVRLGGPPVDNVAIDEEGERTLARLARLSCLLGLILAWVSLRSFRLTMIVFSVGLLSATASLAAVGLCGDTLDAVMMSMPSLVYVLAISGAVHLINYYRDEVRERGVEGAPLRAIAHGWKPALICSVTTAIGLLSLYTSDLVPIRKFGMYSALGVLLMLVVLFVFLPAALEVFPETRRERRKGGNEPPTGGDAEPTRSERWWMAFGSAIIRRHGWVTAACFLVIGLIGYGVTRVRTSINLMELFQGDARILRDYHWLEQHLARLVPMEIVLRFPPEDATHPEAGNADAPTMLERMESVGFVQSAISKRFGPQGTDVVGPSLSAVTFAPPLPSGGSTISFVKRSATNRLLEECRKQLAQSGYFQVDPQDGSEMWRISLRVAAFAHVDYGQFARELREVVEPVLAAHRLHRHLMAQLLQPPKDGKPAPSSVCIWNRHPRATADHQDQRQQLFTAALNAMFHRTRIRLRSIVDTPDQPDAIAKDLNQLKSYDRVIMIGEFDDSEVRRLHDASVAVLDLRASMAESPAESPSVSIASLASGSVDGVRAVYTGVVPLVYKAQRELLTSLIESTFWSFVTITPLLMFVSRGIARGAVAMIPNVLPVLVVFGGMGWLGISVDIGSMMSASIALGVAVDDTIHYLSWFRDSLKLQPSRNDAILDAYRRCATPTLQTALISGLGLSVFAFSTFMPTRQFGFLMLTILVAGVIAELIMLPALLAGPLGRVFLTSRPTWLITAGPPVTEPVAKSGSAPSREAAQGSAATSSTRTFQVPAPHSAATHSYRTAHRDR